MTTLEDLRKNPDIKNELLDGEVHETRRFIITNGQSQGSRDVMFVLYSTPRVYDRYSKDVYLGTLAIDFDQAVINARKKMKCFKIEVSIDELCGSRRKSNTFPCGIYIGKTAAEVFDLDPRYLFWAAQNMTVRSSKLSAELAEYEELAKIIVINENKEKSNPALPIDAKKVERVMEITFKKVANSGYFSYFYRLQDSAGNIYQYVGKDLGNKGDTIELACKVKKNFTSMGKVINKINLR